MRILVAAESADGLASQVSPHFGRCPYFAIADVESATDIAVRFVANPYSGEHQPGQVPAFVSSQGGEVLLTGGLGRRAVGMFKAKGIEAVSGASGTVRQAIDDYLNGRLRGAGPCRESLEHELH
jgi:predicted Fe-Mo cluster-binding NifX family protein